MIDAGVWQVPSQENQDAMDDADGLVVIVKGVRHRKPCTGPMLAKWPSSPPFHAFAAAQWVNTDQHRRVIVWKCTGCGVVWEEPWSCDAPRLA